MAILSQRQAVVLFHLILGLVVLYESGATVYRVFSLHAQNPLGSHPALLAMIEAIAALLFLLPSTVRIGGWILIVVFSIAIFTHGFLQELPLLVYAVGVILVMTSDSSYGITFSRKSR